MESIERIIYLSLTIVVGVMLLGFLASLGGSGLYEGLKGIVSQEDRLTLKEATKEEFVSMTIRFWEQSAMCMKNETLTVYVKNATPVSDEINKTYLFDNIKRIHMCMILQSAENDCGTREHVRFVAPIGLPSIVRLECDPISQNLTIIG